MICFRRSYTGPTSTLRRRLGHQMIGTPEDVVHDKVYTLLLVLVLQVVLIILLQQCLHVGKAIHPPAKDRGLSGPFPVTSRTVSVEWVASSRVYSVERPHRSPERRPTHRPGARIQPVWRASAPPC